MTTLMNKSASNDCLALPPNPPTSKLGSTSLFNVSVAMCNISSTRRGGEQTSKILLKYTVDANFEKGVRGIYIPLMFDFI